MTTTTPPAPAAPLANKTIVITRPEGHAADTLREHLASLGANVIELPLIAIEYTADAQHLDSVWTEMGDFDWIIFTSASGVRGFFDSFFATFNDIRGLGLARIACVGEATATAVRTLHLNVDFQPAEATADALARELPLAEDLAHLRVLVVTGNKNTGNLAATLEKKAHAITRELQVYATMENDVAQMDAARTFRQHGADALLFASPSAVESFVAQAKTLVLEKGARSPKVIAIGPATSAAMREHGIPLAAQAPTPTPEGLTQAILNVL